MKTDTGFFGLIEQDLIDRSGLERWATCPAQAWLVESGRYNTDSIPATTGSEAHECYSRAVSLWVESGGVADVSSLVDAVLRTARQSRPDVQPHVIETLKKSCWTWCRWLRRIRPDSILHFDGGEGLLSGQIGYEVDSETVLTAECDFVCQGSAKDTIELYDWKTGWRRWDSDAVANSFQFQFYAYLLAQTYPGSEILVSIWNSRFNEFTRPVGFSPLDIERVWSRIEQSMDTRTKFQASSEPPPTWPTETKCAICAGAVDCPSATPVARDIAANPGDFIDRMVAMKSAIAAMSKVATEYADEKGDISTPHGNSFGRSKPRQTRRPAAELY